VYAGIAGALAYSVVRAYQKTFTEPTTTSALTLPIFSSAF